MLQVLRLEVARAPSKVAVLEQFLPGSSGYIVSEFRDFPAVMAQSEKAPPVCKLSPFQIQKLVPGPNLVTAFNRCA